MILSLEHPDILKIAKKINSTSSATVVPVIPEINSDVNECIPTVNRKIIENGGSLILGWMLFHQEFMMDAVFHGVWQSPAKDLVDVTPKQPPMDKIIFLPDARLKYEGKQIDSIRLNLSGNSLVDDLITLSEMIYRFLNTGNRAFQGYIRISQKAIATACHVN